MKHYLPVIVLCLLGVTLALWADMTIVDNTSLATPTSTTAEPYNPFAAKDPLIGADVMVPSDYHELCAGYVFSSAIATDVTGLNTTYDVRIKTGASNPHIRFTFNTESEFFINLYEGSTFSATGTANTVINRNRTKANAATTVVYRAPTVATIGTELSFIRVGSGNNKLGDLDHPDEFIFKPNTEYTLRFTKASSGTAYFYTRLWWYEALNH